MTKTGDTIAGAGPDFTIESSDHSWKLSVDLQGFGGDINGKQWKDAPAADLLTFLQDSGWETFV